MSKSFNTGRAELVKSVVDLINNKLSGQQAKLASEFVERYFAFAPIEDLQSREILDLYGAVLSHWNYILERKPHESKVRVYNPHYEHHGWQSTHTIIEISHDDMPFLVDSVTMELNRLGLTIHFIIHMGGIKFLRSPNGQITELLPRDSDAPEASTEAPIYIEIDRQTDKDKLEKITENLLRVLGDVEVAVRDWQPMRKRVAEVIAELEKGDLPLDKDNMQESIAFLKWLDQGNFVYLGVREYKLEGDDTERALCLVPGSGLGVLSNEAKSKAIRKFMDLPPDARRALLSPEILTISKTNTKATVHRDAYTDYIGIKLFNKTGKIIGELRIIGLYTSAVYNNSPQEMPILRRKIKNVLEKSQLNLKGHSGKDLKNILETLPRDDLFQSSEESLLELGMGILHIQERKRIRLFVRKDIYDRFISCLVYIPREQYDTKLRNQILPILQNAFQPLDQTFYTRFSESILARVHFVFRVDANKRVKYDVDELERKIIEVSRSWVDEFQAALVEFYGEEQGNVLAHKYGEGFPTGYRENFLPRAAMYDIQHIENLVDENAIAMSFYHLPEAVQGVLNFKIFREKHTIPLSDVLPILENMGLRVIGERPYQISNKEGRSYWINDFEMLYLKNPDLDIESVRDLFQEAFSNVWYGNTENDQFNSLVLAAQISWREISVLRAYTKYIRQIDFKFSQQYIEETLIKNPNIAKHLIELFKLRTDPALQSINAQKIKNLLVTIDRDLDLVVNLDEDRILRKILEVITATLRTNYFQKTKNTGFKKYISFKLSPGTISGMPLPHPMYEIFVYSPRFEGVHLRSSKVARGGIRWSDRKEDYRTEILGLMKAQNVKNAVIVPSGAKGGFVAKNIPIDGTREAIMEEVITCYRTFIRGLLDVTDNLHAGEVIPPKNTVRYDDDDPYLVVAADKGTATFSDIANEISLSREFWLGDAFASGGSSGYDHKQMGITARGAWESVKRHFREKGVNIQTTDFTVVGIGDMAGDVFGNGMLLSKHIKLVAAFNHQHIFLDPNPIAAKSFKERERLFHLPRSTWEDYDSTLISKGGGIYKRSAKSIKLTNEVKKLLDLKEDALAPSDLIRAILKAPVDMLWNGGIGTYVKAKTETHLDVGDRTNDALRVNGSELQCKVIGEGGNLGLTQLGRVEYSLKGGIVYTDFIDNSAGVDCSDHEVNIKILLNSIVEKSDMTLKQRNTLLAEMTDEVAYLVIRDNYHQTQAISLAASQSTSNIDLLKHYIRELERLGLISRSLEYLPSGKELSDRKAASLGLTRPEIAILFAYTKNIITDSILTTNIFEDPALEEFLDMAFPKALVKKFRTEMNSHILRKEIIATQLSNVMVNDMGITFVKRLSEETGASIGAIVRSYVAARKIFNLRNLQTQINELDAAVPSEIQMDMMFRLMRLTRRATRWFLRNRRVGFDINHVCEEFTNGVNNIVDILPKVVISEEKEAMENYANELTSVGVPSSLAMQIAGSRLMFSALDIVDAANKGKYDLNELAKIYFALSDKLDLAWFRSEITSHIVEDVWDALARASFMDDLDWQQRGLAIAICKIKTEDKDPLKRIDVWEEQHKELIERWHRMTSDMRATTNVEYTMIAVAIRELLDLSQASMYFAEKK